ncbi:MAG: TIGR04013 family B12-binding domain/radical SAM domain-containing protein [Candidatus Heimdallarchaeota archaeon]|nr:TIGR04013 family B12-binding domain/radical SAM domain-containing protein [Candidatus Heimdallarchaeota archaeon]
MEANSVAIVFDIQKKNFYSLASLIATIDSDDGLRDLDLIISNDLEVGEIKNLLKKYSKLIIACSFRTNQLSDIYEKMKVFYSSLSFGELQKITFIAGGSHPTGDPLTTLKFGFDFSFIGEAEYSLPFFLKQFIDGGDIYKSLGIAFLESENTFSLTSRPPPIVLDEFPLLSKRRKLYPPLEITRGCTFGCTFCQVPMLFQHNIRHRSPDVILDTVKWMITERLNDIRFITPNSFGYMSNSARSVNQDAIVYLLKGIRSIEGVRNVFYGTFPGEVRPETVSEDLISKIKPYITNRRVSIGLQSGSNKVLREIRRGHSVEECISAIEILLNSGFTPIIDMIMGLPGASDEDEEQSINVIEDLIQKQAIIRAHVFMPLPGTVLEDSVYQPVSKKNRKRLGRLSTSGKIEGNWTQQELYAKNAWTIMQKLKSVSPLIREDNH